MNKKNVSLKMLTAGIIVASVLPFAASAADLTSMASSLKDAITTIAGSIVFIGWCITGILYLTAAGSPEKIQTAKKALIACVIGTVLVILAGAAGDIMNVIKSAFGLS